MNVADIQNDFLSRRPNNDKHIEMLMEAIKASSGDSTKLMEMMVTLMKSISDKEMPEAKAPEVNVHFDVESLAAALNKQQMTIPEMKAPEVRVEAPVIDMKAIVNEMEARREFISYEFNIKRGSDGKIVSVIANPI